MKILFLLLAVASTLASDIEEWEAYKKTYGKKYETRMEDEFRRKIYELNKRIIDEHNKKFDAGLVSYSLRINQFGDVLDEEHYHPSCLRNITARSKWRSGFEKTYQRPAGEVLPESVDWREKGAVTPPKDQRRCGACWAFSSTGALEGQNFLKTGKLISFSEQNLIDCSRSFGTDGCDGGLMENAFKYVATIGGLLTEESYPYEDHEGECRFDEADAVRSIAVTEEVFIPKDDEEALKSALANIGPISVAVHSNNYHFKHYHGGIFHSSECDPEKVNHAVLAVGYGTENGEDFWIIKNSWGRWWGEDGYIRIIRNKNNLCGVASMGIYPVLKDMDTQVKMGSPSIYT